MSVAVLSRTWRLPSSVVQPGTKLEVLESVKLGRGKHAAFRSRVRVADPSSPCDGFEGWIDSDALSATD